MRFRSAARRRISPRAGKARRGIATPKQEIDLVRRRLQAAERHSRDTHRGD